MTSNRRGPVGVAQVSCGQKLASSGYLVWQFGQTFIRLLASRPDDEQAARSPIVARRQTLVNTYFGDKINNCPPSPRGKEGRRACLGWRLGPGLGLAGLAEVGE